MKKSFRLWPIVLLTAAICMTSCSSKKSASSSNTPVVMGDTITQQEFLQLVHSTATTNTLYVTSKIKFTLENGPQKLNLTGNLRMKRDDVIRLQLMAFGFVEAGRIEFTKEEVLIVDRINKQYIRAPYKYIDFLRNSGINFFTLQALFWNELFIPGQESLKQKQLDKFTTEMGGDEAVIYLESGRINYSWLANQKTGRIKMANIMYRDPYNGNSQLNWNYNEYGSLNGKMFPCDMKVTLSSPKKEVKLNLHLSYMGTDDTWEPRTTVSDKYREVDVDDLIKRIMSSF